MKVMTFEKRLHELEQRRIYRVASLADLVILADMWRRGDPKAPAAKDVEWDSSFEELWENCWKRSHETRS